MAEDTCLGILAFLVCVCVSLAGNETTLTISPAQVSLPTDQALSLTCLKETAVDESVCRIKLLKVSKSSRRRRVLVDLLNDGDMELLDVVDRSSPMVAAGQTADGSLQVNLTEVTCDHDGAYACQVTWVAHGGSTTNQSRVCAMNDTGKFINRNFTDEVPSNVTVNVPQGQVKMAAYAGRSPTGVVSMALNCSVRRSTENVAWKWQEEKSGHVWNDVDTDAHSLESYVTEGQTSSCDMTYSILHRVMWYSDIGRKYRCFLRADGVDMTYFAAYYKVPQAAFKEHAPRDRGRKFVEVHSPHDTAGGQQTFHRLTAYLSVFLSATLLRYLVVGHFDP